MSKELTLAEKFSNVWIKLYADDEIREFLTCEECKVMNEVETALKDYENLQLKHRSMTEQIFNDFKKLKALEIIKEKNINVRGLINSPNLEYYIDHCMPRHSEELTKEEYDLLKEVLL